MTKEEIKKLLMSLDEETLNEVISDVLESKNLDGDIDTPAGDEGGILAGLWMRIVEDLGIKPNIPSLINIHIDKMLREGKIKPSETAKIRSSLLKNTTKTSMSWKVFLELLFSVLNIKGLKINLILKHLDNRITAHSVNIIKEK